MLDSGIYTTHQAFLGSNGLSRIVASVDFTGAKRIDLADTFGHGTHVAGLAAGSSGLYNSGYTGLAPNAKLINLAVLDKTGVGQTSWVLNALDWVMANKVTYNIRVVNMSLGTLAVDSYRNDPLCKAVRKLVDAGVVVVAAGNLGSLNGQKYYGLIESPGNEPSAITVGASNTFGTDSRADDVITTYSSRGPTRSWWTDDAGVAYYDNVGLGRKLPRAVPAINFRAYRRLGRMGASINQLLRTNREDRPSLTSGLAQQILNELRLVRRLLITGEGDERWNNDRS